ncbi:hypothetical protein [Paraburkholderia terrae]|uniref:terminase small subunit-like protein n=1 Tax=Paraburkholderia terrae TaxID=311230 RepID=UPI001EE1C295|nr:hypothetical protein [Paraburkholderia terrae]GJH02272.1 hypothetical protein CBA19C8_16965 [Paraburkholderia terrae]
MAVTLFKLPGSIQPSVIKTPVPVPPPTKKSNAGRKPSVGSDLYLNALSHIAKGLSVSEACKQPNTPSVASFFRWKRADPLHEQMFYEALGDQTHDMVDDVFRQIDARLKTELTEQVRQKYLADRATHARWVASRRNPRDYGSANTAPPDNVVHVEGGFNDTKGGKNAG